MAAPGAAARPGWSRPRPRRDPSTASARTAYVANLNSDNVTPIDTATNTAGTAIVVGSFPSAVAITPDGATAYVANTFSDNVTPIDTATNTAETAIAVGDAPSGVAIIPCTIIGTAANDRLAGTAGDDVICGVGGNDRINGRGGDDQLIGGPGSDELDGGEGANDRANYAPDANQGVEVDLSTGTVANDGQGISETLVNVVEGAKNHANTLAGDGAENKLIGGQLADELSGGGGADLLRGEFERAATGGDDTLVGGDGVAIVTAADESPPRAGDDPPVGGPAADRRRSRASPRRPSPRRTRRPPRRTLDLGGHGPGAPLCSERGPAPPGHPTSRMSRETGRQSSDLPPPALGSQSCRASPCPSYRPLSRWLASTIPLQPAPRRSSPAATPPTIPIAMPSSRRCSTRPPRSRQTSADSCAHDQHRRRLARSWATEHHNAMIGATAARARRPREKPVLAWR